MFNWPTKAQKLSANPARVDAIGRKLAIKPAATNGVPHTAPPIIFINAWPDSKLANSRILRDITRAKYEITSNTIKYGAITNGAPDGKNKFTYFHW